jgi:hypothetical protein
MLLPYFDTSDAAGPTEHALTGEPGAFTLTGSAATLSVGRSLAATEGAYVLTGTVATLAVGRQMAANAGAYSLTGADAGLALVRGLIAESGGYSLAGTDAGLAVDRLLAAEAGEYLLTGADADLETGAEEPVTPPAEEGVLFGGGGPSVNFEALQAMAEAEVAHREDSEMLCEVL